jgi:DNA-binding response OmpR family regulator
MMDEQHFGSDFDDFLRNERLLDDAEAVAAKRVVALQIAQEMKRLRPDLLVGLVTGWGATLDKEKARVYGVDLVISKPFRFEQVLGIVDEALLSRRGKR